tara:strand:+ start:17389 stop:18081 length:693 start_codon:yes stop_codon:yes gene_type:complete
MSYDLPNSFKDIIERPQSADPLLWLLDLEIDPGSDTVPPVIIRVCDGSERLTWPVDDPQERVWDPFPFTFSPVTQTQEGDLTEIDLSVDNTARLLMRWLHAGDGLEGNRATLFLVPKNGLDIPHPNHEFRSIEVEVSGVAANDEAVTFRLAKPNWFSISSPTDRYVPKRCRHEYGSDSCGYVLNEFAAHPRCGKLQADCIERGLDLRARGLPEVLPANYGGHPGVSRRRA